MAQDVPEDPAPQDPAPQDPAPQDPAPEDPAPGTVTETPPPEVEPLVDSEPSADEVALRDEAIALFCERCRIDPGTAPQTQATAHWSELVGLGYTPEQLVELARALPDGCAYASFRSALLSSDHGVADRSMEELASINGTVRSSNPDAPFDPFDASVEDASLLVEDDNPSWKAAMRRRIGRYELGWIVPLAIVDGGCRSALILFFEGNPSTAVIPYATVGSLALISGLSALGTLGGIRNSVDGATSRQALYDQLNRQAGVAYGIACTFLGLGGTAFSTIPGTWLFGAAFGAAFMIIAVPIFHAAITLSVLRDEIYSLDVDEELAQRRRDAHKPRIVAVSPLGFAGVW
jgi:hypothetical protein